MQTMSRYGLLRRAVAGPALSLAFVLVSGSGGCRAQEAPKRGESVTLEHEARRKTVLEPAGDKGAVILEESRIARVVKVTVTDVDENGLVTAEVEVLRIHGVLRPGADAAEIAFDSVDAEKDGTADDPVVYGGTPTVPIAKMMTVGVRQKFRAQLDARGRVSGAITKVAVGRGGNLPVDVCRMLVESAFGERAKPDAVIGTKWPLRGKPFVKDPFGYKAEVRVVKIGDGTTEIGITGAAIAGSDGAIVPEHGDEDNKNALSGSITIGGNGFVTQSRVELTLTGVRRKPNLDASFDYRWSTSVKRVTDQKKQPR